MRLACFLNFSFAMFLLNSVNTVFSQAANNKTFIITGRIIGRDTGTVVLYYADSENNNAIDSAILKKGKFRFSGTVNRVCDAHLWTDLNNHDFSDPSVVRFLLEPKNINILFNNPNAIISGSKSQVEKEKFDKEKSYLLVPKNQIQTKIDSLYKLSKLQSNPHIEEKTFELHAKIDSVNDCIKSIDLEYIKRHKNSYLSGFLLSTYKRKLPIDTLQVYYSLLGVDVKNSSEGKKVIEYVYPLTTDNAFRSKNSTFGLEFDKKLSKIKSIYDFSLNDKSGKKISFKIFKDKYLLIDFWASWCGPCIDNFPYLKKLIEEYKSDSIQFISVSLDKNSTRWKAAIKKYNLPAIQLSDLKGFDGLLPVYCKVVTSIPRYVLIDKSGKIINYDTPQPMDPGLKILIDNLLKKGSFLTLLKQ